MASKLKGFLKKIKNITQLFARKEHEIEIGYPTDVKHVAHIGWDSTFMDSSSWVTASDFSSASLSNFGQSRQTSWASQDFDQLRGFQPPSRNYTDHCLPEIPKVPKKTKRKKTKISPPSSSMGSSSWTPNMTASYSNAIE